jgi:iron(III) transport system permease protein
MLQKYVVNKKSFTMSSLRPLPVGEMTGVKNVIMHVSIYLLVALSMIPQLVVIYTSFLKTNGSIFVEGYSLDSYRTIFESLGTAVSNTYAYSTAAMLMIVFLGMTVAYLTTRKKSWLTDVIDTLTMFPYIIPGSVLGITLLLAFNEEPMLLSGTAIIIIISLVIRRLPYTLRSSSAILYQLSPSLEEASISLGASPVKTFFKVTAVMMLPGVMSGAIISWITAINELSSSVILFTGATKTMSVAIYTEVIRASYGTAAALSTILTATTILAMVIFFKVSGRRDVTL